MSIREPANPFLEDLSGVGRRFEDAENDWMGLAQLRMELLSVRTREGAVASEIGIRGEYIDAVVTAIEQEQQRLRGEEEGMDVVEEEMETGEEEPMATEEEAQ